MKSELHISLNKAGGSYRLPCSECNTETRHATLQSVEAWQDTEDGRYWDDYQVVQCLGCETISFRRCWRWVEDTEPDGKGGERMVEHVEIYPSRLSGRKEMDGAHLLPTRVRNIYRETRKALVGGQPVLAGVGIRAIVEAVCRDRKATSKELVRQIDELVAMNVLTPDGATILHSTRLMGNLAAHEVKEHTVEELSVAMDVIEHLLAGVYVMPEKAKRISAVKNP